MLAIEYGAMLNMSVHILDIEEHGWIDGWIDP